MSDCPVTFNAGDYEMTQDYNKDDSKVYIRVKLTDSAYRAIEEYQQYSKANHLTNEQNPKMKMNGNTGIISIPTFGNEAGVNFGFSLDAVQGSMEAVQQTAEGLNSLGTITHSMRIHANEDVFAETRTKMAMSEESERSKCTKVIKPSKSEIGRKVKKPVATLSAQHMAHNNDRNKACPELPAIGVTESSKGVLNAKTNETDFVRPVSKPAKVDMRSEHNRHGSASSKRNGKSSHKRDSKGNTVSSLPLLTSPSKPSSTLTNGNHRERNIASNTLSSLPLLTTPLNPSSQLTNRKHRESNMITPSKPSSQLTNGNVISSNNGTAGQKAPDFVRPLTKPKDIDTKSDHKRHSSTSSKSNSKSSQPRDSMSNTLPSLPNLTTPSNTSSTLLNDGNSMVKRNDKEVKSQHPNSAKAKSAQSKAVNNKSVKKSTAKGKQPDITRCKIKERIIQMLALRPYKKLELYTRLQNEGLRDAERQAISTILREIAFLRDNAFNLRRHIWNIVKEDWPFYNEAELQQLKENKPKDLTPPISSDTASPPLLSSPSPPQVAPVSDFNYGNSLKRPGEVYQNPVLSKKQRISLVKTKERVGNRISPTSENTLVYNRNTEARESNQVFNGTQIIANCVNPNNCENTSDAPSDQHLTESKPAKCSAPLSVQHPTERVSEDKSSSGKSKGRKSKKSSAPESNKQPAEIVSTDKGIQITANTSGVLSDQHLTESKSAKCSAPLSVQHPTERVSEDKSSSGKSKGRKPKKSLAPESVKQPAEIVSTDKGSSSSKRRSSKPKGSTRSEAVGTDTQNKENSAAPVAVNQPAGNVSGYKKSSSRNKADKSKKSSTSVAENQPVISADKSSNKKKASNSKNDKESNTFNTDTEKQHESSRSKSSKSKETTQKSKSNNNADLPASPRKETSKPQMTVPPFTDQKLKTPKEVEQQSSLTVKPQQQITLQEPVAQHSTTNKSLEAGKHREQRSSQHILPQQRLQQQYKSQEPAARRSGPKDTFNAHKHVEQGLFDTPQQQVQQQIRSQEPVAQHSTMTDAHTAEPQSRFDFSMYTPITCVEQRRLYKAEFESHFEEYDQLSKSVEQVRRDFHILVQQLGQFPPGSPVYQHIQQKIEMEFERLNTVEEKQRKLRFDYLQAKLGHITQLVNDYDQKLKAESAAIDAAVLQHQLLQQQQQMLPITPIEEPKEIYSYAMNGSTHVLTAPAQPSNGHVPVSMVTDVENEVEVAQPPPQVSTYNMQQNTTNGVVWHQEAQQQNSVAISNTGLGYFRGSQFIPQQTQHQENGHQESGHQENGHHEDNDLSDSDDSDDSSNSSEEELASFQGLQFIPQQPQHQQKYHQNNQEHGDNNLSDSDGSDDSSDSSDSSNSELSSVRRSQFIAQQPQHQGRGCQNYQGNQNDLSGSDDSSDSSSSESEDSDSDNDAE
ncbi:RNA polymerase II elongation factor Ell-like [Bactrocera dorsalis]|uniref:RNA polymerase II elongation factor Ell-like n=1 Tax=Bactrocera dorsalis TaxID=27457 RepID=A0A8N4KZJ5_BACDO|nr:RNA polymerase II elongation factor Ell-like [Bactrocera dorsalis]